MKAFRPDLASNIAPASLPTNPVRQHFNRRLERRTPGLSGDREDVKEGRSLTQLRSFAEREGVGPEFGDGGAVEDVIAHRVPEAGSSDHVQHVEPGAQGSGDAAE